MKTRLTFRELSGTLLEALLPIYGSAEAQSICKIYLEDRFGIRSIPREGNLSAEQRDIFLKDLQLFREEMPVQYIVGKTFFYDYFFEVNQHTLIPRPETEELVAFALERLRRMRIASPKVLDIGTGTGCIAISMKKTLPPLEVSAIDVSGEALAIARQNAERLSAVIDFSLLDFIDKDEWGRLGVFDLIVSNPPYVSAQDYEKLDTRVKAYEPRIALTPALEDALVFYRMMLLFAQRHLKEKGEMVLEIGYDQKQGLTTLLESSSEFTYSFHKDMQGKDRILHLFRS